MSENHAVTVLCEVLEVSRSGYYSWLEAADRPRARQTAELEVKIAEAHESSRCTYGSPRITAALRACGIVAGRNRVARIMQRQGLRGRQPRRYRRTTDSNHDQPIAPNLLRHRPPPTTPNEVWVADITYIETAEGWLYLAGVLDLCTRRLVGWAMGPTLDTSLPQAALSMALSHRRPPRGLIHHSDRGCQYASEAYRSMLAANGCLCSMSRKANCYDNSAMESFWSSLKQELVYRTRFINRSHASSAIFDYIETFYNRSRLHSSIGMCCPLDFEASFN